MELGQISGRHTVSLTAVEPTSARQVLFDIGIAENKQLLASLQLARHFDRMRDKEMFPLPFIDTGLDFYGEVRK